MTAISVLVVDDHVVLSQALAVALRSAGFEVIVALDLDRASLIAEVASNAPTVTLLDMHLGVHGTSIDMIGDLVDSGSAVIMLTASEDRTSLAEAIRNGASTYVHKSDPFDGLVTVVREVAAGRGLTPTRRSELIDELQRSEREQNPLLERLRGLSAREREVLALLIAGRTPAEIASSLFVAVSTIRSQQKSIYRKLGVNTQLAAVALARRAGFGTADS